MKKKLLLFLTLMVLIPLNVFAEELKIDWLKSWGGSNYDYLQSAFITDDGGFIVLGKTDSDDVDGLQHYGSTDAVILKYDQDGNLLWQKNWGGNGSDILYDLTLLDDGSFIAEGISSSTDINGLTNLGKNDGVVVKFDKNGNMLWQKNWGGKENDYFRKMLVMNDGSFFVVGESSSTDIDGLTNKGSIDAILLKYDKNGNLLWQKNWGGNKNDKFANILYVNNDEFIVVGSTYSTDLEGLPWKGNADFVFIKYDKNGNIIWNIRWGGSGEEIFADIDLTDDGGFVVSGGTYSSDIEGLTLTQSPLEQDAILLKFDKDGKLVWQKSNQTFSKYSNTIVLPDGNLFVNPSNNDTLIKYDKNGNILWEKSLDGEKSSDYFTGIFSTEDGGVVAYGALFSLNIPDLPNKGGTDNVIVKFDKDGNIVWKTSFGGTSTDRTMLIIPKNRNTFIEIGYTMSSDIDGILYKGQFDLTFAKYVVKYNIVNIDSDNGSFESVQNENYGIVNPSPDKGYEVDKIIVKDSTGNEITSVKQNTGVYSFELYDDVTVKVVFKKIIENPNTGGNIFIILMFVITISFIGVLFAFKKPVKVYEV